MKNKKQVFYDGHERPDVREYRKEFLEMMCEYERGIAIYKGDDMEIKVWPTDVQERKVNKTILITHDGCCYRTNDGRTSYLLREGESVLKSKSPGHLYVCSDFLCTQIGRLALTDEQFANGKLLDPTLIQTACVYITPGMNKDDYWNGDTMVEQMEKRALPISKILWPRTEFRVVWAFDQSTGHGKYASNALKAKNMNLYEGGSKPILGDGWYIGEVRDNLDL